MTILKTARIAALMAGGSLLLAAAPTAAGHGDRPAGRSAQGFSLRACDFSTDPLVRTPSR